MTSLAGAGLSKICLTYVKEGRLNITGAIIPAATLAAILEAIDKEAAG